MAINEHHIHPALLKHPAKLYVEVTSRCNLNCFMCVKQQESGSCDGDLSPEAFARLEPAFAHLDALVLNGVGEPLLNPHLESFIRTARQAMPASGWIGFQSNGLLLNNLRAISLVEAGVDKICLSVDGATRETFRKVRDGGELIDVNYAFAALAAAKVRCNRPDVQVGVEFVVMRNNLFELPDVIRWAAGQGASFAIVSHALPYDERHASEVLHGTCTEEAVALFARYLEEAVRQGLDMYRYFEARWKYRRNDEEQKLVSLVNAMKSEADSRGIFIDMKKLLRVDAGLATDVAAVFAEADAAAREAGVDLRLPGLAPASSRHCHFVENGGAFVTWNGDVAPCYFLWHRYRCFASGWDQQVQARTFGNVNEQTVLEIWNSAAFRDFREQVIGYDFANCATCSLAPCDYVQTEQFEQDCHIRNVPCGACLWCSGMYQCLY